jgi:phage gp45-like
MIESDVRRFIQEEIRRQVNILLHGQAGTTTNVSETIDNMYPAMPSITDRPVMHPYGFVSRAPKGTISVTGRIGEHAGNRFVMGHRDISRPTLNEGESILYNQFGQTVYLEDGNIHIGTKESSNPVSLGNEIKALWIEVLDILEKHTHVTPAPGSPTSKPIEALEFTAAKAGNVTNDKILSDYIFVQKAP